MLKDYYSLTKSGLVYGNLITVIGGFALGTAAVRMASGAGGIDLATLAATIVGISLVMASGCVFNNVIDRDIDAAMIRTKDRALVTRRVSARAAILFGTVLGAAGFTVLAVFTNLLTVAVAGFGFFAYVVLYSLWAKRRTVHGTIVGSISGATPPVVGYVAATGRLDAGALILFAILVLWQMPHFYAIAIRRADDYASAHIPVLPVKSGVRATKIAMIVYIIAFTIAAAHLTIFHYAGSIYFAIALVLGLSWLGLGLTGFKKSLTPDADRRWARTMFFYSLFVLVALFTTITITALL